MIVVENSQPGDALLPQPSNVELPTKEDSEEVASEEAEHGAAVQALPAITVGLVVRGPQGRKTDEPINKHGQREAVLLLIRVRIKYQITRLSSHPPSLMLHPHKLFLLLKAVLVTLAPPL